MVVITDGIPGIKGKIDGDIGPKTKEAIKAFKIANGLRPDFFPGPRVKALLGLK